MINRVEVPIGEGLSRVKRNPRGVRVLLCIHKLCNVVGFSFDNRMRRERCELAGSIKPNEQDKSAFGSSGMKFARLSDFFFL